MSLGVIGLLMVILLFVLFLLGLEIGFAAIVNVPAYYCYVASIWVRMITFSLGLIENFG